MGKHTVKRHVSTTFLAFHYKGYWQFWQKRRFFADKIFSRQNLSFFRYYNCHFSLDLLIFVYLDINDEGSYSNVNCCAKNEILAKPHELVVSARVRIDTTSVFWTVFMWR